jgi:hypothetical protein
MKGRRRMPDRSTRQQQTDRREHEHADPDHLPRPISQPHQHIHGTAMPRAIDALPLHIAVELHLRRLSIA